MDHQQRFLDIVTFLAPFRSIWTNEVIDLKDELEKHYPSSFLASLRNLSEEDLWKFDCLHDEEILSDSDIGRWNKNINQLCKLEWFKPQKMRDYPDWAFNKVKYKKRYEITVLADFFSRIKDENPFEYLIDIGGGVGHLSRVMAHYHGHKSICLDINPEFQKIGNKRLEKYPKPEGANDVTFVCHDFTNPEQREKTKKIFNDKSFSLGLHTCGNLATSHLEQEMNSDTKGFINFGCCYNKLEPHEIGLSQFAKDNGLEFSKYSAVLASRGHATMDFEDFKLKKRVKFFRYCLQLYFEKYHDIKAMLPVGDSHPREYLGSFSDYAIKKLSSLNMEAQLSKEEFEDFFTDKQDILNELFLCNIIRWKFGRPLEFYILLDRVLYMKEKGKNPSMLQFFPESISPRNIGIFLDHN